MNKPLLNFQLVEADKKPLGTGNTAKVFPFKAAANELAAGVLPTTASALILGHLKNGTQQSDRRLWDYVLLGALALWVHGTLVSHLDKDMFAQELIEPAKEPPKVQINLVRPQPPKPIVQPPPPPPPKAKTPPKPPVPKAVPLKPKPKPKLQPKPIFEQPIPQPAPAVESKGPVTPAAPPVVQPPAPPPIEEKVTEPKAGASYLHNPAPEYPEAAMERGLEGKVLMKVHVMPNGKPDTINVTKSSGYSILDDAAIATVKQWSFVPAMRGKTPIAGWVSVPITFNLQN
jgi:protein TonB